eukprot:CAMPEP_0172322214 /NCGR_PEP_ID=MMETSP1058-20130122/45348_1 /TAXON_ID=83371 /ORGANISM="Detonula confervacea, Strain CCMP 353" /LENGTH=104 /DNA_ID=CAMNT_0013037905 /DNA_START=71 /DNA_END=381 /DNA_ORIENTATION=-
MPATPPSNKKKGGCHDLLNDFSLPEEHTDRFVSIDRSSKTGNGNSITSSPTATPGSTTNRDSSTSNTIVENELARSKKEWGRAIDRYVMSVLEDDDNGEAKCGS